MNFILVNEESIKKENLAEKLAFFILMEGEAVCIKKHLNQQNYSVSLPPYS